MGGHSRPQPRAGEAPGLTQPRGLLIWTQQGGEEITFVIRDYLHLTRSNLPRLDDILNVMISPVL